MKALTMTQPWATLVALGEKGIETRSWATDYRSQIAIHAAKGFPDDARWLATEEPFTTALGGILATQLPLGKVIAVATITFCNRFTDETAAKIRAKSAAGEFPRFEADFGDFSAGRYGFKLEDVRRLAEPIPARGILGLWNLPADVDYLVREQLQRAVVA